MRSRQFLLGLAGGLAGTVLVVVLLFALGFLDVKRETVIERVTASTPATFTSPGSGNGLTPAEIYQREATGVVMVISTFSGTDFGFPFGGSGESQGLGSGFVISEDGYVLTNAHVVEEQGQRATSIDVVFKGSGTDTKRLTAKLVGVDASADVALLKVDPSRVELNPLPLGDSDGVQVGSPVVAIGNPLGYDFSLSAGVVSATGRNLEAPNNATIPNGIQTDAAINQGNSGGPLIDANGNVVGINEQIASPSGSGNVGLGFAVPINLAKRSVEQLRKYGQVKYAWLGIQGQTITPDIAHAFKLPVERGILIADVVSGSPAARAGLKGGSRTEVVQGQSFVLGGDVIVKLAGTSVASMEQLIAVLDAKQPGDKVTLDVLSDGKQREVEVTLGERPANM